MCILTSKHYEISYGLLMTQRRPERWLGQLGVKNTYMFCEVDKFIQNWCQLNKTILYLHFYIQI